MSRFSVTELAYLAKGKLASLPSMPMALRVPKTQLRSHAANSYSCIKPPRQPRRRRLVGLTSSPTGSSRGAGAAGAAWPKWAVRRGRCGNPKTCRTLGGLPLGRRGRPVGRDHHAHGCRHAIDEPEGSEWTAVREEPVPRPQNQGVDHQHVLVDEVVSH